MTQRRSRDAITAATSSVLKPALAALEFSPLSRRSFARVRDCICQRIDLQVTSYGGRDFRVWIGSDVIALPSGIDPLPGVIEILTDRPDRDRWWSGQTHQDADRAMADIVALLNGRARSFLAQTRDAANFFRYLTPRRLGPDHHRRLARACCAAWIGRRTEAISTLREAIELYISDHLESAKDGIDRSWCLEYVRPAKKLLNAISDCTEQELLQKWAMARIKMLKLPRNAFA
jgi:hypothetical protein